jgi:hypothetical protein
VAGTLVRQVLLKISADDGDTEVKLERIKEKADELARDNPELKVRIDTAAASAKMAVLRQELKSTADAMKADMAGAGGPSGLLGRLLTGATSGGLTGPAGIAGIAAAAAVLLPEIVAVGSGFAAAAVGAGAFYLLAHPAINNLTTDYKNLDAAQTRYQLAQNAYAADPSKTNAKALQAAADNLKAVQMSMSQDAGSAAGALSRLAAEWGKITTAFQPEAFKVFAAGLKLIADLLPAIVPFATTFADVMTRLLGMTDKFAQSKGFQQWLAQFHSLEGPALNAIGQGIGQVAIQFGKLLTMMSAKDVVNGINIAFTVLRATLVVLGAMIKADMLAWDGLKAAGVAVAHGLAGAWSSFASAFQSAMRGAEAAAHAVMAAWDALAASARGAFNAVVSAWNSAISAIVSAGGKVISWFGQLPGRIIGALASLGTMMFNAGVHAIQRLIDGLTSKIGDLGHAVASIASKVAGFFGLSPAKEGPLSGSGAPEIRGAHFADAFAGGMTSGLPQIAASAARLAGAAALGAAASPALAGGGRLQVEWVGGQSDQQFMTWLKKNIRIRGGDPGNLGS